MDGLTDFEKDDQMNHSKPQRDRFSWCMTIESMDMQSLNPDDAMEQVVKQVAKREPVRCGGNACNLGLKGKPYFGAGISIGAS